MIEAIRVGVEKRLVAASATRTFTQMQLPFAPTIPGETTSSDVCLGALFILPDRPLSVHPT